MILVLYVCTRWVRPPLPVLGQVFYHSHRWDSHRCGLLWHISIKDRFFMLFRTRSDQFSGFSRVTLGAVGWGEVDSNFLVGGELRFVRRCQNRRQVSWCFKREFASCFPKDFPKRFIDAWDIWHWCIFGRFSIWTTISSRTVGFINEFFQVLAFVSVGDEYIHQEIRLEIRRLKTGPNEDRGLNKDLGDYVTTSTWNPLFEQINSDPRAKVKTFESMTN